MSEQSKDAAEPKLDPIPGVEPPDGAAQYVTAKQILERSEKLVDAELRSIGQWLEKTGHTKDTLMGLALSGGGIRSATFSLGVMQELAKRDLLRKMDYLSTVSGGGYMGSSLSWWLRKGANVGLGPDDFPYGSDPEPDSATDTPAQKRLRYLSQHGKYLTPGKGITLLSGIAILLRAMFVNLAVWVPVLIVVMMLLVGLPLWNGQDWVFGWLLRLAAGLIAFFGLACLFYSFRTAALRRHGSTKMRYFWRRVFEKGANVVLVLIGAFVVIGSMPAAAKYFAGDVAGPGAVVAGLASAIWSFFKSGQKQAGRIPLGVLATVGAGLLIYGLLLTAYAVAAHLYQQNSAAEFWAQLAGFAAIAYVVGWFANVNYISPHRFYRDRLMEAFLPNPEHALNNVTAAARKADVTRLSEMNNAADGQGPYHLVNTNVLLVDSERRRWRIRGGDNFILSPIYCGSNATGWSKTQQFLGDGMTLPTAMAISGAAANPNTGVGGVGLTRNPLVSILMALLNLRLGYWAQNPLRRPKRFPRPNHFRPGMYEVGSLVNIGGLREDRPFVQLSDGGHFENLAVYELIRRKLRLIIVCDAGADPGFKFADLQTLLRRIEADFGAIIRFSRDNEPATLVPSQDAGYPMGSKDALSGHIVGDITYHDESRGKLILLKTTMVADVRTPVKGYKAANPDFPDQTTADQFFDEEQFDSYRELGQHLAEEMATKLDLSQFIGDLEEAAGNYVPTPGSR